MCNNPVTIRNPYFGQGSSVPLHPSLTFSTPTIEVPCRTCSECLSSRRSMLTQRMVFESLTSYVYMVTLTYDDDHLPLASVRDSDGTEVKIPYSDYDDIQLLVKRLRAHGLPDNRGFRYFVTSEFGSKRSRPHFHMLLFVARLNSDTPQVLQDLTVFLYDTVRKLYARNVGTRRSPIYEPLFTYRTRRMSNGKVYSTYDLHLLTDEKFYRSGSFDYEAYMSETQDVSLALAYVSKYLHKACDESIRRKRFFERHTFVTSDGKLVPRVHLNRFYRILQTTSVCSKGLGFGFDPRDGSAVYVRKNLEYSSPSAQYRDDAVNAMYREYLDLPPLAESACIRFLDTYQDLGKVGAAYSVSDDTRVIPSLGTTVSHAMTLLLMFSKRFRTEFLAKFPEAVVPRRVSYSGAVLVSPVRVGSTTYYPGLNDVDTPTVSALRKAIEQAYSGRSPYNAFNFPGSPRQYCLSSYYKQYVSPETRVAFLKAVGCKDLTELSSRIKSLVQESPDSEYSRFIQDASYEVDYSPRHSTVEDLDNLSELVYLGEELSHKFAYSVHQYELSYY